MTVKTKRYGKITAEKNTILSLIVMLREAKEHYRQNGMYSLANDTEILINDLRAGYYGQDDFEI